MRWGQHRTEKSEQLEEDKMLGTAIRRNIPSFLLTTLAGVVLMVIAIFNVANSYSLYYRIEIWMTAVHFFSMIYPLLSSVPFCWRFFYERKDGYLKYTVNRYPLKRYVVENFVASGLLVFLCIFIISFSSAIISLFLVSPQTDISKNVPAFEKELLGFILLNNPVLYSFILSLWRGVLGAIYFTFGFVLSLFYNNIFIVMTAPFVYSILENFTMSILGCPQNSIITSFMPTRLAYGYTALYNLLVGPAVLIGITGLLFLHEYIKRRKEPGRCLNII